MGQYVLRQIVVHIYYEQHKLFIYSCYLTAYLSSLTILCGLLSSFRKMYAFFSILHVININHVWIIRS